MRKQDPMTQTLKISDVKNRLSRLVTEVSRQETRILVERAGIPVAALVSTEDLKRLDRVDRDRQERERRFAVIDQMREAFRDVPPEEIERETAKVVAEVRAEIAEGRTKEPAASM